MNMIETFQIIWISKISSWGDKESFIVDQFLRQQQWKNTRTVTMWYTTKNPRLKRVFFYIKEVKKVRHIQINFRKRIFFNIREIIIQKQPYYDCYRVQGKVRKYSVQGDIFKQKSHFFRQIRRFVYFTSSFLSIEKNSITLLF